MNFFTKQITISKYLAAGLIFWFSFCLFFFLTLGPSLLFNLTTLALCFFLTAFIIFFFFTTRKTPVFETFGILSLLLLIYCFPRLISYLVLKQENLKLLYILFPKNWTATDVNKGLVFFILGVVSIALGLFLGNKISRSRSPLLQKTSQPSLTSLVLAGIIIYSIDGYFTIFNGLNASSNCQIPNLSGKWLIHFFSGDIFLFLGIGFSLKQLGHRPKASYSFLFFHILIFLIYSLMLGSRGGGLRVFMIFCCLFFALHRDFKIKPIKILLFTFFFTTTSSLLFKVGTVLRETNRYSCPSDKNNSNLISLKQQQFLKQFNLYESDDNKVNAKLNSINDPRNLSKLDFPPHYLKILDRLGTIDYPLGILTTKRDEKAVKKYMSFDRVFKSIINNIVIGSPYPDPELMTNNMMPLIYRGFDIGHVRSNFLSEPWTLWGVSYLYFGYAGGIIFMFLSAIIVQAVYNKLDILPSPLNYLLKAFYLWIFINACYYFMMGFDHAATVAIYAVIQLSTSLGIIYSLNKFILHLKQSN